jgi:tRNA wybutosine-synthesizing protein 3
MGFDLDKKNALSKMNECDKSRKGSVDILIAPLIKKINSLEDYYTTSSCSGRIMVYSRSDERHDSMWIYVTHEEAILNDVLEKIKSVPEEEIWFKQESFILHIAAKDIKSALKLMELCKTLGLKRTGINSINNKTGKIVIEIINHLGFDFLLAENNRVLVDEDYIKRMVVLANQNMAENKKKIKMFLDSLSSL